MKKIIGFFPRPSGLFAFLYRDTCCEKVDGFGKFSAMKLLVFLAFFIGLASSLDVQKTRAAERTGYVQPQFPTNKNCACTKEPVQQCGCCADFQLAQESHRVCLNMTLIKNEKAVQITVVYDGKVLLNKTISAINPPPFCQGIKPVAYICEKYYNMSYGDDNKWGGCFEITGGIGVQILDVKLGCYYLPVGGKKMNEIAEEQVARPLETSFKNVLKESLAKEFQQWYGTKFGNRRPQPLYGKKSGIMLKNILFKNDGDDGEGIEVPDIF